MKSSHRRGAASAEHLVRQGHEAMTRGDLSVAVERYRAACEADPGWAAAYGGLGAALYRSGQFDEAITVLEEALRLDPTLAESWFTLGLVHKDEQEYEQAEVAFSRAVAAAPEHLQAYYHRGRCRYARGDAGAAAADFRRVVELDPNARDAYYNLAVALAASRAYDRAEKLIEGEPLLAAHRSDLYVNLGLACSDDPDVPDTAAVRYFEQALEADPGHLEARYRLGLLYARDKYAHPDLRLRAISEFEALLSRPTLHTEFSSPHRVYFAVGTCYDDVDADADLAIDRYQRCLELAPEFAPALNNLAILLQKRGEVRQALDYYSRAILADPDYAPAYHNLSALYYDQDAATMVGHLLDLVQAAQGRGACERVMVQLLPTLVDVARADALASVYDHLHATKNLLGVLGSSIRALAKRAIDGEPPDVVASEVAGLADVQSQAYDGIVEFLRVLRPPPMDTSMVDVNETVRRAVLTVQVQYPQARVELNPSLALPRIRGDARRLREMVVNVVQNAAQASAGKPVQVSTDLVLGPSGHGSRAEVVRLIVSDSGPGIPESHLRDVLRPGFTTKEGGSGFGLTIAAQIAREHLGRLHVDSTEGEGTTVCIELPAAVELHPEAARLRLRPVIFEDFRGMIRTEVIDAEAADDREPEILQ
ncbi:MAG TPA: tetratricopeptide repeat protein [Armatimonadota bacterium]|nr:tetratricopeptide repeat protein [Armatimonadota bacterium]HQK93227.1 tetratricopeptide repeat protein [Armatimonadota bacterium]